MEKGFRVVHSVSSHARQRRIGDRKRHPHRPGQTLPLEATLDAIRVSLGGIHLSQVAFGVLGVLVITSEYVTGMIRVTLGAVLQRAARREADRVRWRRVQHRGALELRPVLRLPGVSG
jgi:hypothetical protein